MTLTDPKGGGVYGGAGPSTITLCPGATNASLVTSGKDQSRLGNWFNAGPTVICPAPIVGPDGSTGYGNTGVDIITGPGQFNTDFSLGKITTVGGIRENAQLAFRVEFYNAFNHPQFANPGTTYGTANFGVITQSSVAPRLNFRIVNTVTALHAKDWEQISAEPENIGGADNYAHSCAGAWTGGSVISPS
jgi:hypothetical protein